MDNRQVLETELRRLKIEFLRLRRLYLEGKISQREFVTELKKLRVKDNEGKFWTIGAQSGQWYYFNGQNWIRAEPPLSGEFGEETSEPSTPFMETQVIAEKGGDKENEISLTSKSFRISPEVALLDSELDAQNQKQRKEKFRLISLPLGSTSLFFGGLGILLGILMGAIAGSTRFFIHSFNFLPLFLQEIMGKLTGGLVFAALGGLVGFVFGCLAGLLVSLIFNFTSSLTGGLVIKAGSEKRGKE